MGADSAAVQRIREAGLELRVIEEQEVPAFVEDERGYHMNMPEGHCVFLAERNLCGIHKEMGYEAKPEVCKIFPYLIIPTPDGVRVAASFYCTAVQRNHGQPLSGHRPQVVSLLDSELNNGYQDAPILMSAEREMSWSAFDRFHSSLEARLEHEEVRPALEHAWSALNLLHWGTEGLVQAPQVEEAFCIATPRVDEEAREFLRLMALSFTATVEGMSSEHMQQLTEALTQGGEVELPRRGFKGSAAQVEELAEQLYPQLEGHILRYTRALLFRRALGLSGSIHRGLISLTFVDILLPFYVAVSMMRRQGQRIESQDLALAYEQLERELMLHYRPGLENFLQVWADGLLEFL